MAAARGISKKKGAKKRARKTKAKVKDKGPPRTQLDLDQVEILAGIQCTDYEIALVLGVSEKTIQRRKADDAAFLSAYEKGRADGRVSLRKWQFEAAKGRSNTMLIWLGKQYLGQTDKADLMSGGEPFRFTIAINGEHEEDAAG